MRPPALPFGLAYVTPALLKCEVPPIRAPQALGGQLGWNIHHSKLGHCSYFPISRVKLPAT